MSELKYLASKNGLKYKIVRFEAGPEGKRALSGSYTNLYIASQFALR